MGAAAVPVPVAADAAVSITIQLRKLIKPERMGVYRRKHDANDIFTCR